MTAPTKAGEARRAHVEFEQVIGLLQAFFDRQPERAKEWMKLPNPILGGMVPTDMLLWHPGKLLRVVTQTLAENAP